MTYYYLAADGTTAGPEPLDVLTALAGSGVISLATLVVPAGGEDWTPLARVLRFFHPDESGATTGPVAFSELHRLNQIAVLTAETWVLEEGGSEWKALVDVLAAGGVAAAVPAAPVAAPPLPRTATGAYRPQAGGKTQAVHAADPYAPPHSSTGHHRTVIVKRKALGGIGRLPYFLLHLLVMFLAWLSIFLFVFTKAMSRNPLGVDMGAFIQQFFVFYAVVVLITLAATTVLTWQRLKNIGWPVGLMAVNFLPVGFSLAAGFTTLSAGLNMVGIACQIAALILGILLLIMPPGFARHGRFDTAAKVNSIIIGVLVAGIVALMFIAPKMAWDQLNKEAEETPAQPAKP